MSRIWAAVALLLAAACDARPGRGMVGMEVECPGFRSIWREDTRCVMFPNGVARCDLVDGQGYHRTVDIGTCRWRRGR